VHPNSAFRPKGTAAQESVHYKAFVREVGFGMIFATTPNGPRVAHAALLWADDGVVQFHLSHRNAMAQHIDGMRVLAVINGPEGYVSPRWYEDPAQVPTWNYVTLEMEGRVRRLDTAGLSGLLERQSAHQEGKIIGGVPWTMDKLPPEALNSMLSAIIGFELGVDIWRPTFKLSQNKSAADRARVAAGLETQGSHAIAKRMRSVGGPV